MFWLGCFSLRGLGWCGYCLWVVTLWLLVCCVLPVEFGYCRFGGFVGLRFWDFGCLSCVCGCLLLVCGLVAVCGFAFRFF